MDHSQCTVFQRETVLPTDSTGENFNRFMLIVYDADTLQGGGNSITLRHCKPAQRPAKGFCGEYGPILRDSNNINCRHSSNFFHHSYEKRSFTVDILDSCSSFNYFR